VNNTDEQTTVAPIFLHDLCVFDPENAKNADVFLVFWRGGRPLEPKRARFFLHDLCVFGPESVSGQICTLLAGRFSFNIVTLPLGDKTVVSAQPVVLRQD